MNLFLACLAGYCLGNFSSAIIIGKVFLGKDVRDYGSGNAGATNAVRAFGAKVGLVVFILDVLKGVFAVLIGRCNNGPQLACCIEIQRRQGNSDFNWSHTANKSPACTVLCGCRGNSYSIDQNSIHWINSRGCLGSNNSNCHSKTYG